jgi:hypothetical protein
MVIKMLLVGQAGPDDLNRIVRHSLTYNYKLPQRGTKSRAESEEYLTRGRVRKESEGRIPSGELCNFARMFVSTSQHAASRELDRFWTKSLDSGTIKGYCRRNAVSEQGR